MKEKYCIGEFDIDDNLNKYAEITYMTIFEDGSFDLDIGNAMIKEVE